MKNEEFVGETLSTFFLNAQRELANLFQFLPGNRYFFASSGQKLEVIQRKMQVH
jgi:hypothetical protein